MVVSDVHVELDIVTALQGVDNSNTGQSVYELDNRPVVHVLTECGNDLVIQVLHQIRMAPDNVRGVLTAIEGKAHQLLLVTQGLQQLNMCQFHGSPTSSSSSSLSSTTTYR